MQKNILLLQKKRKYDTLHVEAGKMLEKNRRRRHEQIIH